MAVNEVIERARRFRGGRVIAVSLGVMLIGAILCLIGLFVAPGRLAFSYLMAFAFTTSIAVGALLFAMICYAMNAKWVVVVRRIGEAVTLALIPLALAFVPIVLAGEHLYAWVTPHNAGFSAHELHLLEKKTSYLNLPFFAVRGAIYFAIFILVAVLLRVWSVRRDRRAGEHIADAEAAQGRMRMFSAGMLPAVALALTFAAFDWMMSLEPLWLSSIYGVYVFAGGFVASISVMTILTFSSARSGLLPGVTRYHYHALGRLMFAFTVFWAYCAFFQAMLIKIANRPEEVTFYILRSEGSWMPVVWVLIVGHFAVPFALLLLREPKYDGRIMTGVAIWIVLMHLVDVYWLVMPVQSPGGIAPHWLDLGALAFVGGLAVAFATWRQRGKPLLPIGDPYLAKGLAYRSM